MSSVASIYEPRRRPVKFDSRIGHHKPAALYAVIKHGNARHRRFIFNVLAVRKFGLGTKYQSCDVYLDEERKELVLELHASKYRGQRVLSFDPTSNRTTTLAMSQIVAQLPVHLEPRRRYAVSRISSDEIVIALDGWEPAQRSGISKPYGRKK